MKIEDIKARLEEYLADKALVEQGRVRKYFSQRLPDVRRYQDKNALGIIADRDKMIYVSYVDERRETFYRIDKTMFDFLICLGCDDPRLNEALMTEVNNKIDLAKAIGSLRYDVYGESAADIESRIKRIEKYLPMMSLAKRKEALKEIECLKIIKKQRD